jgi:predicted ATP-grasp superfamily ATP-dependent carboligase
MSVATTINKVRKFSVLIPDGENEHVLWVARSLAASKQVNLYILSDKRWTPVRFSRHCRLYQFRSTGADYQARLKALADIMHQVPIDIILPVSEDGILFAITTREALSKMAALPPLPERESLCIARNKWLLNQFAYQQSIPAPQAVLATFDSTFHQRISALEYPVLLKPTTGTDGQGIRRFDTPADLWRFLESQDKQVVKDRYLVQTFVPGYDIGLSVLCRNGEILAYTIQQGIISASHRFGPLMAMEFISQDDVLALGQKLLSALRWSGVAHVDFRYDSRDNQVKILEVNARYWGSLLGSVVAGVNFPYLACLAAQEVPFARPEYCRSRYAHTTTALKEGLLSLLGKNSLSKLNFRETGLRFFGIDPLPEVVKRVQELDYLIRKDQS